MTHSEDFESIQTLDIGGICSSSFNIFLGRRRSGKSVLCEYIVKQMYDKGLIDGVVLFSKTNAGFEMIEPEMRFTEIDKLHEIMNKYKAMNNFNKVAGKRDKIRMRTVVIIDDMATDLKSKGFDMLPELATNGRHLAYFPLALHFMVLSQSLTAIPRIVRLNADQIFFNALASAREVELVCDECLYLCATTVEERKRARELYKDIVSSEPFIFICVETYKQNIKTFADYLKKVKATCDC